MPSNRSRSADRSFPAGVAQIPRRQEHKQLAFSLETRKKQRSRRFIARRDSRHRLNIFRIASAKDSAPRIAARVFSIRGQQGKRRIRSSSASKPPAVRRGSACRTCCSLRAESAGSTERHTRASGCSSRSSSSPTTWSRSALPEHHAGDRRIAQSSEDEDRESFQFEKARSGEAPARNHVDPSALSAS